MNFQDAKEWYPVTLPSRGKFYGEKLPDGKVEITPWTVEQEEVIDQLGAIEPNEMLKRLLTVNVKYPAGFGYGDLLATDQYFILVQLRCVSIVPYLTLTHACADCGNKHEVQIDLRTLPVKEADEEDTTVEPFLVFLPKKKLEVGMRFIRVEDELASVDYVRKTITGGKETARKFLYARQIATVAGQSLKFDEKMDFIQGLAVLDLEVMRRNVSERATGLTGSYSVKCSDCGKGDLWRPPLHPGFFRPSGPDITRAVEEARRPA